MPHRECRDEVFAHAVAEVLGISVAVGCRERQDRDRRPRGGCRRNGYRLPGDVDEERVDRMWDVLDVLSADVLERRRNVELVSDLLRDADAARPGETFEPRCNVDPGAVDPVLVDDYLPAMHPDAELHALLVRAALVRREHEGLEP